MSQASQLSPAGGRGLNPCTMMVVMGPLPIGNYTRPNSGELAAGCAEHPTDVDGR